MIKCYIQKESKEFDYDFCYEAYSSFIYSNWGRLEKIYEVHTITFAELKQMTLSKNDLFIGSVEFMKEVFKLLNIVQPPLLNIPQNLTIYAGRKISEGFKKDLTFPCFIKPATELKLFTGSVISKAKDFNLLYPEIKDDTKLLISEVVDFVSEYRCFVHEGKLVDIKHYFGDFKIFPNIGVIEKAVVDYKNSPISYTLDFGITDKRETLLVEANDFYSCGTYGFSGEIYAQMLRDRFREIIAFSEWLEKNRWFISNDGKYHYTFEHGTVIGQKTLEKNYIKTSEELFQEFKNK